MTNKELKALIKLLRGSGIRHYKTPQLSLELLPEVPMKANTASNATSEVSTETYSEQDTLFWSSGGIPEEKES